MKTWLTVAESAEYALPKWFFQRSGGLDRHRYTASMAFYVLPGGRLEVPGVRGPIQHEAHLGLRRHVTDVVAHLLGKRGEPLRMQQLEAIDQEVFVLARRHAWTPALPSFGPLATIDGCPKKTDDDRAAFHISQYK